MFTFKIFYLVIKDMTVTVMSTFIISTEFISGTFM